MGLEVCKDESDSAKGVSGKSVRERKAQALPNKYGNMGKACSLNGLMRDSEVAVGISVT
jgi:hypothetical protein